MIYIYIHTYHVYIYIYIIYHVYIWYIIYYIYIWYIIYHIYIIYILHYVIYIYHIIYRIYIYIYIIYPFQELNFQTSFLFKKNSGFPFVSIPSAEVRPSPRCRRWRSSKKRMWSASMGPSVQLGSSVEILQKLEFHDV